MLFRFFCTVFGCWYHQHNRLPRKTRLQNDVLCVEWDLDSTHYSLFTAVCAM